MLVEIMKGNYTGKELVFIILVVTLSLTLSFAFHEFMHALAATWLGDDTPGYMGRLTLNPVAHLDPIGTVCLILLGFGWGKPVRFNPNKLTRFKSKRLMLILVAVAGVVGNFILALLATIALAVYMGINGITVLSSSAGLSAIYVAVYIREFSLGLLAFNLLPIPPLDGFRIVEDLLPLKVKYSNAWKKFCYYGPNVLTILVIVGAMTGIRFLSVFIDIIKLPFDLLLNFIFSGIWSLFL